MLWKALPRQTDSAKWFLQRKEISLDKMCGALQLSWELNHSFKQTVGTANTTIYCCETCVHHRHPTEDMICFWYAVPQENILRINIQTIMIKVLMMNRRAMGNGIGLCQCQKKTQLRACCLQSRPTRYGITWTQLRPPPEMNHDMSGSIDVALAEHDYTQSCSVISRGPWWFMTKCKLLPSTVTSSVSNHPYSGFSWHI